MKKSIWNPSTWICAFLLYKLALLKNKPITLCLTFVFMGEFLSKLIIGEIWRSVNILGVVLLHDTQSNESRSTIHNSWVNYIFLCMLWTDWHEGKQLPSHRKLYWIIRTGLSSIFIRQKADKITHIFFPAGHISFRHQRHLVCLENYFMQFIVKYNHYCSGMLRKIHTWRQA